MRSHRPFRAAGIFVFVLLAGAAHAEPIYRYDGLGRVTHVIEAHQTATFTYDPAGAVTSITIVLPAGTARGIAPLALSLGEMSPSPIQRSGSLRFTLPRRVPVRLTLLDAAGREVARPVDQVMDPGMRVVTFQPTRLATGEYSLRLESEGTVLTRAFRIENRLSNR